MSAADDEVLRAVLAALEALAEGDFSARLPSRKAGLSGDVARAFNTLADRTRNTHAQVVRGARVVGREGRMGERIRPAGPGQWAETVAAVNDLIDDLARPTTEVARVLDAVAKGDLTESMALTIEGRPVRGEFRRIGLVVNRLVEQLASFADEVSRVAREVGTEGRLGGQARVKGVSGTWKSLTDNVNELADNLTRQVRNIAQVTTAVAQGDLSQKITVEARGEILDLKSTVNTMVDTLSAFADEVSRVAREVGVEGRLGGQAHVRGVSGTWKHLTDNVNQLADNLTGQVRNIAQVTTAVANGDLSQKITVEARGEVAQLKTTINTMVDQLSGFADEVTRVAREVGVEGILGGQAQVRGVSGTWKELTDNVNQLADNLTGQVRDIAQVTTAVAKGDLSQKITVEVRGELLAVKNTVNRMVEQLSSFAIEVTRVAREVGIEGRLGAQADVPGVSGTWKSLTVNVNELADNLTQQVRAIAEVSTAVTQGDLTRLITVDAAGEVGELKDTINQMIDNLRDTTQRARDQDWLKTNLARVSSRMQGHRNAGRLAEILITDLAPLVDAHHAAIYVGQGERGDRSYWLAASYGFTPGPETPTLFAPGEGLLGQAARDGQPISIEDAPASFLRIASGLGDSAAVHVLLLPVAFEGDVLGVVELAGLRTFSATDRDLVDQVVETAGVVLSSILATMRTEELLKESQRLTAELQTQSEELQSQQDELRRSNLELEEQAYSLKASEELLQTQQEELQLTNSELEEKAAQLAEQNEAIEVKNTEIELARRSLEERAEQLALSSRYKSEFLANMSHELRTPLNSLLILARLLADNVDGNLSAKQVEFAHSIHGAGADLLNLISDILDLSKVEAGKMELAVTDVALPRLVQGVEKVFRPLAEQKTLALQVEVDPALPPILRTDEQRLMQVLTNLLGNAVKFTDSGAVALTIRPAAADELPLGSSVDRSGGLVAFEVSDSGIGISQDKLAVIFEAFQQADGTTSRRYGGTGLGLSISREIAHLLGGEIRVTSQLGAGSIFSLLLPLIRSEERSDMPRPVALLPSTEPIRYLDDARSGVNDESPIADDRGVIVGGDRVLLLVGAEVALLEQSAEAGRERGFRILVAHRGDLALRMAREYRPDAVVLDAQLPGVDGLAVLEELKRLPETRHIPVHVMSSSGQRQSALSAGAIAYLEKPVSTDDLANALSRLVAFLDAPVRRLLIVEDDERERSSIIELIGGGDNEVVIVGVGSSEDAIGALEREPFDCMVLDLKLPQTSGFALLEQVKGDPRWADMPVIVYTGKELSRREDTRLKKYAETIIVKDVRSPERLLDETALFLHRVESRMPAEKRRIIEQLHSADAVFEGKRVLIVDDDVRNVFALTSAFEGRGMQVQFAENGREGVDALLSDSEIDLVLMDIMMPEMDGYEAMRAIREVESLRRLPIIALTAKAMKGDREQCIEAGASDYITKPIDIDQLLSLMRVWLY